MDQTSKELLLKDLCARLPYGVKFPTKKYCEATHDFIDVVRTIQSINSNGTCRTEEGDDCDFPFAWSVRPYLFPLSSMTEKQNDSWRDAWFPDLMTSTDVNYPESEKYLAVSHAKSLDWLYKNHIDIYGLIPKGLAIDATGLNVY